MVDLGVCWRFVCKEELLGGKLLELFSSFPTEINIGAGTCLSE